MRYSNALCIFGTDVARARVWAISPNSGDRLVADAFAAGKATRDCSGKKHEPNHVNRRSQRGRDERPLFVQVASHEGSLHDFDNE